MPTWLFIAKSFGGYVINVFISNFPFHRVRLWCYRRFLGYKIGKNTTILMGATFTDSKFVEIGSNTVINAKCHLDGRGLLVIGDNVSISTLSTILTADHDIQSPSFEYRKRSVTIHDYAFIGAGATVLPGVTIGYGAVVAAGAVVASDVPDLTIVGGVPAKKIGERNAAALNYRLDYRPPFQ